MTQDEKITCYYCNESKDSKHIFYYEDKGGVNRAICEDCRDKGKHWE